eukprot:1002995-Rhodomonas_salina.2
MHSHTVSVSQNGSRSTVANANETAVAPGELTTHEQSELGSPLQAANVCCAEHACAEVLPTGERSNRPGQTSQLVPSDKPCENVPAGHSSHAVADGSGIKDPAGQDWHGPFPGPSLNLPASHAVHSPATPEKPGMHTQCASRNEPAGAFVRSPHAAHVATVLLPVCKWFSGHVAQCDAPVSSWNDPAGHAAHSSDPTPALWCPAGHGRHGPPGGPERPASHTQSSSDVLAGSEEVCSGQSSQPCAPSSALNAPGRQPTQSSLPRASYPAAHVGPVRTSHTAPEI